MEVKVIRSVKSPEEILQEEFLRERAAVLGKAGEKMASALRVLEDIEKEILMLLEYYYNYSEREYFHTPSMCKTDRNNKQIRDKINSKIQQYNEMRKQAKLRYYYLIVTREALGFKKHQWVEAYYRIPTKREYLEE